MQISVTEARARLTDLVCRAQAGQDIVLTRHGRPAVRLASIAQKPSEAEREALLDALHGAGRRELGANAAHATDRLYDDGALPA